MPQVSIGQVRINYREQGRGFPGVLLVHGAGGSSLQFAGLANQLARGKGRVVVVDLPGHGASDALQPPPAPALLLESYRDVLAELGERLGLGRFLVVGHSMGGAVALHLALAFPQRLAGLVLVATAARLRTDEQLLATVRRDYQALPATLAAMGYSPATPRARAMALAEAQIQATRGVMLADLLACDSFDVRDRLDAVALPAWVISADDDAITPPGLQRQLALNMPRARLQCVSRAGHFVHLERPEVVAATIRAALATAA